MKKKISAEIIADSVSIAGDRVTTFMLTFPRFILPELNTHRMLSKNSASSRAIPFKTMVKSVEDDPFIPIAWQKEHKGMQGSDYFTDENFKTYYDNKYHDGKLFVDSFNGDWLNACYKAIDSAKKLSYGRRQSENHQYYDNSSLTKQLTNRILEPFMWHTVLLTATELENFYELRCPKYQHQDGEIFKSWSDLVKNAMKSGGSRDLVDGLENYSLIEKLKCSQSGAEIHIQALAEAMWDAQNESTPKLLQPGEWHIPFGNKIDDLKIYDLMTNDAAITNHPVRYNRTLEKPLIQEYKIKISTARCARLSYMTFDGEIDYEKDIKLHDQLHESKHFSPFEHCCKAPTVKEISGIGSGFTHIDKDGKLWSGNFKGFIQYRHLL